MSYRFSRGKKTLARERANGRCEFPGESCNEINNGIVHHITGVFEAKLSDMSPESISDINLNAIMLCNEHAWQHDEQEGEHNLYLMKSIAPEHPLFKRKEG